ncbi:DICT sensory domain-containing protein [Nostoc sp. FACHB-110]|uniref:DICT sensory domain-containing protein n=1 Tax=Nostoc sp. FACHB-110 TaxID=2692834 RepID=UPI0016851FAC|nr:DICT sensory domain-containing protein [Nostoc sp. FACHB-110]MBD2438239.1 ATPase [Nostoc sp. FACHB-110]
MNDSLRKQLSIYQLALGLEAPPQAFPSNPATLLALLRAQIDILIEQEIAATFWVKLPPGKIWHAELERYQSAMGTSGVINTYRNLHSSQENGLKLLPNHQLRREYFFIVISPQFCNLIVVRRTRKRSQNRNSPKGKTHKMPALVALTTMEKRLIQQILEGIQQATAPESQPNFTAELTYPNTTEPAIVSRLLAKQLQRQNEINRQVVNKRITKLKEQNQKLQNKEQLKDGYLSSVCQELRTPLTHMKTALSLLNSPTIKPPQRQRYLQMLNTQCDRQSILITGLLDLINLEHQLEQTSLELVRLSEIVPGIVSTYQPVAQEKGIMLAYTVPPDLPTVWCVAGGLRQIVINLLQNSIKFTPKGGQVWVRARLFGDYIQLEFRDTGIGIAESEISKIFDCFYRVRSGTAEELGGAGLGLTIVKRLLWRCGGSILVRSKPDEGSTFIVQLLVQKK